MVMRNSDIQYEIMKKIQRKIDKDIERMKSKKDMDMSVEKQIRKQLLDLYLFQNAEESQKKTKLVDRLNKRAKDILEQNEQELLTNSKKKKQLVNANDYYDLNQWKQLSQEMRKNNDKCQICGAKSQDVHHVFPFMHQSPELREEVFFDKDNLLCLCEKCHYAIHHNKLLPVQKYWYEKLRNQISQKYLNQGKILSWL